MNDLAEMNEQELMHLLVTNDLGAWAELVKRYGELVYSISFQVLKNNNDTEDAVQNTFVNLKLYASKFDQSQPLKPWLARIASIEAIRIYKKKKYINKKESVRMDTANKSHQSQRRDASEIVEQKEIELMVKKAIDTLPDNSRVALTLYYAGGLNQSEIADQLGISQVRISMAIKSGLDKVKTYLKKAGINAAIILSPNLMQEGILSTVPPQALLQKLIIHLPTEVQLASAASTGTQMALKKGIAWWFWSLISIPIITYFSYLYWPTQVKPKLDLTIEKNALKNYEGNKNFNSVDFNNYEPLYYQWVTQQFDTKPSFMAFYGGDPKWTIQKNDNGQNTIKRNPFKIGEIDGLFLAQKFNKAYQFHGLIKVTSKNSEFGFFSRTPLKEKQDVVLEGKKNCLA